MGISCNSPRIRRGFLVIQLSTARLPRPLRGLAMTNLRTGAVGGAISGRHCRSERAIVKRHAPPICHCKEAGGRRGNLAVLARITEKLRRIRPPERQSRYETVLCLPFDQQRKYCPVHRHDKRPAKKIVRTPRRPCRELYKAISCS